MPVKNVDYGSHMPGILGLPDKILGHTWVEPWVTPG